MSTASSETKKPLKDKRFYPGWKADERRAKAKASGESIDTFAPVDSLGASKNWRTDLFIYGAVLISSILAVLFSFAVLGGAIIFKAHGFSKLVEVVYLVKMRVLSYVSPDANIFPFNEDLVDREL